MSDVAPLRAEALDLGYDQKLVVEGLNLEVPRGRITTLVGPNGSGKSTILKALVRVVAPRGGQVLLDGRSIHETPTREVARRVALLPQVPRPPSGLSVRELVQMGRYPYRSALRGLSEEDHAAVDRALSQVELTHLAQREVHALSGGQMQRVWVAMALAQETGILLLDEPTTYLDIAHQLDLLALLRRLNRASGLTVVMAIHDLNLAARHSDWMIAVRAGRVVAEGPPADLMNVEVIERVFGVRVELAVIPGSSIAVFVPHEAAPVDD